MTIDEAIEVLELHNQWRKGADIPMETPVRIGMAIDLVVCELKNLRIAHVIKSVCDCGKPIDSRYAPCCSLECWNVGVKSLNSKLFYNTDIYAINKQN